jgi:hypothetical protein
MHQHSPNHLPPPATATQPPSQPLHQPLSHSPAPSAVDPVADVVHRPALVVPQAAPRPLKVLPVLAHVEGARASGGGDVLAGVLCPVAAAEAAVAGCGDFVLTCSCLLTACHVACCSLQHKQWHHSPVHGSGWQLAIARLRQWPPGTSHSAEHDALVPPPSTPAAVASIHCHCSSKAAQPLTPWSSQTASPQSPHPAAARSASR